MSRDEKARKEIAWIWGHEEPDLAGREGPSR